MFVVEFYGYIRHHLSDFNIFIICFSLAFLHLTESREMSTIRGIGIHFLFLSKLFLRYPGAFAQSQKIFLKKTFTTMSTSHQNALFLWGQYFGS